MLLVPTIGSNSSTRNLPTQASHCMANLRRGRCKKTVFQKNRKYVLSSAESPERIQCSPNSTMQWNVRWSWFDCYVHDSENRDTDCSTGAGSVVVGYRCLASAWPLSGQPLHCFPGSPRRLENPLQQLCRDIEIGTSTLRPPSTVASPCCSVVLPSGVTSDLAGSSCSPALVGPCRSPAAVLLCSGQRVEVYRAEVASVVVEQYTLDLNNVTTQIIILEACSQE